VTLIQINNDDDCYCLFYAIALTKYYLTMPKTAAKKMYFERLVTKPEGKYRLLRRNMVGDLVRKVSLSGGMWRRPHTKRLG